MSESPYSQPERLKIHTWAKPVAGIFGSAVGYQHYLLTGEGHQGYNGILYSRVVHPTP